MANTKNKEITARDDDFAAWYTDIVLKSGLADYSCVKGCMIIKPYGFAIWENMQAELDKQFKKLGHKNIALPLFIPESYLNKEKDHVEGFAPEVAWVTHGGKNQLEERLCVRPTSEVLFCDYFARELKSYRDLPILLNQWCNVVRWEKETRPFLRTREFLWQEGHTIHATKEEAVNETLQMLNVYKEFYENVLAIPVLVGEKTEKEKFAGAENTYTVEALMYNGVSLQSATSHYFGQGFSKAFNVKFLDANNKIEHPHQTSWGTTTRGIGGVVMVHGDDNGLVLPPRIAPYKAVIIPIGQDEGVIKTAEKLNKTLIDNNVSCFVDTSKKSPGFKFAEHEMKGVPIRIEIGLKDLANNEITLARRDTSEKSKVANDANVANKILKLLDVIHNDMFKKAKQRNDSKTYTATTLKEVKNIIEKAPGFIKAMWCGSKECELKMKEINGIKSRCIPFEQKKVDTKCICCGKKASKLVVWGIQY